MTIHEDILKALNNRLNLSQLADLFPSHNICDIKEVLHDLIDERKVMPSVCYQAVEDLQRENSR